MNNTITQFLVRLTDLTYNKPSDIPTQLNVLCSTCSLLSLLTLSHTITLVVKNITNLYVAFSGTNDIHDIIDDMNILKSKFINNENKVICNVHHGFNSVYREIQHSIIKLLSNSSRESITVTGHSSGGVFASLLALDFNSLEKRSGQQSISNIVTFGEPKWYFKDSGKIDHYLSNHSRYIYKNDLIVSLPNLPWYTHDNSSIPLHINNECQINEHVVRGSSSLTDHKLDNYIHCLSSANTNTISGTFLKILLIVFLLVN
jgi:predicted lipase